MNFTKFDKIQMLFSAFLLVAIILNLVVILFSAPRWLSTIGLGLALVGCVMTNITAKGDRPGSRVEVKGNSTLAAVSGLLGIVWVFTYGVIIFFGTVV